MCVHACVRVVYYFISYKCAGPWIAFTSCGIVGVLTSEGGARMGAGAGMGSAADSGAGSGSAIQRQGTQGARRGQICAPRVRYTASAAPCAPAVL